MNMWTPDDKYACEHVIYLWMPSLISWKCISIACIVYRAMFYAKIIFLHAYDLHFIACNTHTPYNTNPNQTYNTYYTLHTTSKSTLNPPMHIICTHKLLSVYKLHNKHNVCYRDAFSVTGLCNHTILYRAQLIGSWSISSQWTRSSTFKRLQKPSPFPSSTCIDL